MEIEQLERRERWICERMKATSWQAKAAAHKAISNCSCSYRVISLLCQMQLSYLVRLLIASGKGYLESVMIMMSRSVTTAKFKASHFSGGNVHLLLAFGVITTITL